MQVKDFDFELPQNLIAQSPIEPRDHSRLLVLDKKDYSIEHKHFYDIVDYFQKGDLIVMNNSKVMPARIIGKKKESGGRIEVFLLKNLDDQVWQCMVRGRRIKIGMEIELDEELACKIKKDNQDGTWEIEFDKNYQDMMEIVWKIGKVPLPPYIKNLNENDKQRYQTVYADKNKTGSVAAPTAGLHFTPELLQKLKEKGVRIEYITLHVGLGTFAPVKADSITDHKMHAEWVEVDKNVLQTIIDTKKNKGRVITVGTTSTRTLEAIWPKMENKDFKIKDFRDWVNIFIYPGYKFKVVDGIITNFHLPKSTLIMLVSAFVGSDVIKKAYKCAIENKYRFYSYGDAMLIL